ncbi:hypothetical protein BK133_16655 [Paenibacillus sp. FSL H8-0548]|uniref:hypothetical protein n=1 Tax=Paenibacillus sp. FSL H8-0548 TaxID=1920422 RepID=UPI00096F2493|nr:hypothetical protein [Paenibacillus sp. FSL H8-0548]OMF30767.1 hypothetical protein BK133_16655 [Paenibacillus sp. FSL H8-0548]
MPHPFMSISEALSQPRSRFFGVTYQDGSYLAKDEMSFFGRKLPDPELSFDISNNKTLVNVNMNGSIKLVSIYHGNYYSDNIPGVWMCKDFKKTGPYGYKLQIGEELFDLSEDDLPYATSLLDNLFPITEFQFSTIKATLITYTPLSGDGTVRLRGLIYGLLLENQSQEIVCGKVSLPSADVRSDLFSGAELCVHPADLENKSGSISFKLSPGKSVWVPAVISPPGEKTLQTIDEKGSLHWLNETWAYFKGITGSLKMENDPFVAEFYERAVLQCFGSIGMDGSGSIAGSNWGTYPTTEFIWNKDMYYSFLPFHTTEPELFKQGLLWFLEHGVRPAGNRYKGGITHSLSNSLSSVIMAGLYYRTTGDKRLFLDNTGIDLKIRALLEETARTRKPDGPWLFPSVWLSDAYSLGDYHTGSNVIAWASFFHYARIVEDVFGDTATAERYRDIAARIQEDLEQLTTTEGPFGRQYVEGISISPSDKLKDNAKKYEGTYEDFGMQFIWNLTENGKIDLLHHDGEESDTILMPLYGYTSYVNPTYSNYMRFSLSTSNPTYNPESRGIQWGDHSACTFPGYMSGMGMITNADSMSGEDGYFTQIRKLTDADGSLWWWPYNNGSPYGDVVRHNTCGKCGWASGVFAGMFVSEILGLAYDAPAKQLSFRPFSPTSPFVWDRFKLGSQTFSVSYRKEEGMTEAVVTSYGPHAITAIIELPSDEPTDSIDFQSETKSGDESSLRHSRAVRIFRETLQPGETKSFTITTKTTIL